MAAEGDTKPSASKGKTISHEEIVNGYQKLREDQMKLIQKLSQFQSDFNERKIVCETLEELDGKRKCFRKYGDVLIEHTVTDVLKAVNFEKTALSDFVENTKEQIDKNEKEISDYKEKYNIRVRGQADIPSSQPERESKE